MRVLMVLSKPVRTDGRVRKEAEALMEAGWDVHITEWGRHGASSMEDAGVQVHSVGQPFPAGRSTTLKDMRAWWRAGTKDALRLHRDVGFDVIHCHDLDTLPIGARVKRRTGIPLIYDVHDKFSWMLRDSHGVFLAIAAQILERILLQSVDQVITVNATLARGYEGHRSTTIVANCGALGPTPDAPASGAPALYIGTFERRRLMPGIVTALGEAGVEAWIGGKEGCFDEVEAEAARWSSIRFLGEIPHADVPSIIRECSVMLCPLDPSSRQMRSATATKALDAMEAGRPILVSNGTLTADIVEGAGTGVAVGHDPASFVDAARDLQHDADRLKAMGAAGRNAAEAEWNWESQAVRLVDLYRALFETEGP